MAKKTLTPEQAEIKAMKKAKSSQNWTKFWAIVLAGALAFGVVAMGQNQAKVALEEAAANSNQVVDQNNDVNNNDVSNNDVSNNDVSNNDSSSNDATNNDASNNDSSNNNASNNNSSNNNAQQNNGPSKADVAKALNEATAKASKASYDWTRTAKFTKNIDVGALTSILDGIIKGVDENASLNSVVGSFLGIKETPFSATVANGQLPESGMNGEPKYLLKAMTLTEADIKKAEVNGNSYTVYINDCTNPNENSTWAHASDDYITFKDVNESIASALGSGDTVKVLEDGSKAVYKDIVIKAVIDGGKITSLEYSYTFDATIKIKAVITATGSGAAKMEAKYSNFKY